MDLWGGGPPEIISQTAESKVFEEYQREKTHCIGIGTAISTLKIARFPKTHVSKKPRLDTEVI